MTLHNYIPGDGFQPYIFICTQRNSTLLDLHDPSSDETKRLVTVKSISQFCFPRCYTITWYKLVYIINIKYHYSDLSFEISTYLVDFIQISPLTNPTLDVYKLECMIVFLIFFIKH